MKITKFAILTLLIFLGLANQRERVLALPTGHSDSLLCKQEDFYTMVAGSTENFNFAICTSATSYYNKFYYISQNKTDNSKIFLPVTNFECFNTNEATRIIAQASVNIFLYQVDVTINNEATEYNRGNLSIFERSETTLLQPLTGLINPHYTCCGPCS